VSAVYNRATYRNDKRRALALWAEHLMSVVEEHEQKVIPLRPESA
jgi:hypothetical protein